jgi:hypothetical protein
MFTTFDAICIMFSYGIGFHGQAFSCGDKKFDQYIGQ